MVFPEWIEGDDLWDAMYRLYHPYVDNDWNGQLKEGVEKFGTKPWEE